MVVPHMSSMTLDPVLRRRIERRIPDSECARYSFSSYRDDLLEEMVVQVTRDFYGRQVHTETQTTVEKVAAGPDGWWQAFRDRWMPRRWLRRHPVRFVQVDQTVVHETKHFRVCPHVGIVPGPDQRVHLTFLRAEDDLR